MEGIGVNGMKRAKMESIRGFFLYVAIMCQDMNPYLKGWHMTLKVVQLQSLRTVDHSPT